MTPDLELLKNKRNQIKEIIDELQLTLTDDPNWDAPSDNSYLNEEELAIPEIQDNVTAIKATNKLISWFGQDHEGFVGLWRGPNAIPLDKAQVVRLNDEANYELVADTVPNYLMFTYFYGDEDTEQHEYNRVKKLLTDAGFTVAGDIEAIYDNINYDSLQPEDYKEEQYNQAQSRR